MYKTVLKKRSANITRRNISPRTENNEPSEPTVIEVPRIEINYIYPKIRSTVRNFRLDIS